MISLKEDMDLFIQSTSSERQSSFMHPSSAASECRRKLWLDFRNVFQEKKSASQLKRFQTGKVYEARIVGLINQMSNWKIRDCQKEIKIGITKGFIDGIVVHSNIEYLLEIKSLKEKYYNQLVKKGIKEYSTVYYAQVQIYMRETGLKKCIFIVVNKNNDEFYEEIIDYDEAAASMYVKRLEQIAYVNEIPAMVSQNPTYFGCKMCDHYKFCHEKTQIVPTCRACVNFTVKDNVGYCNEYQKPIPIEFQHKRQTGTECKSFCIHPDLKHASTELDKIEKEVTALFGSGVKRII